jgi:cytochrome P450
MCYHGSLNVVTQRIVEDSELRDTRIKAGRRVLISLATANCAPRQVDDVETFDISWSTPPNLGFGHDIHSCVDARLAQAIPDTEVVTEEFGWAQLPLIRGPGELQLNIVLC